MRNNVVIYTDSFMDGVIDIVESTRLSIQIQAVPSYAQCLKATEETPNLLGVLCIDYQVTSKTEKFYKGLIERLDNIALSQQRPLVLSVMYRNKLTLKYIQGIRSKHISVAICKYDRLNEEMIRLDGLVPILVPTLGVFRKSETKHFEVSEENKYLKSRDSLLEALVYILGDNPSEDIVRQYLKKHSELRKIYSLRSSDEYEQECLELYKDSLFGIFCEMMISKR